MALRDNDLDTRGRVYIAGPDRPLTRESAATAIGFGGSPLPRMELQKWQPVIKGSLRGFADVEFRDVTLDFTLPDIPVHLSHGSAWAAVPGKPVLRRGDGA